PKEQQQPMQPAEPAANTDVHPTNHERPSVGPTRKEKETMEDFATALETFTAETELLNQEHRPLKGTVLKITPTHVVVDIGYKSEGLVPIAEFQGSDGNVTVQPGEEIDVMVEHGEREEGYVVLSHAKAQRLRVWDDIEKAYNEKTSIRGKVVERVKGGLS